MTESEAKEKLEFLNEALSPQFPDADECSCALQMGMDAIKEVQQYREFKAIFESHFSEDALKLLSDKEEFARWLGRGKHVAKRCGKLRVELDRFEAIGTVSEFRESKEKATAKKVVGVVDYVTGEDFEYTSTGCPICQYHDCGLEDSNDLKFNFCPMCGQKLDWSEGKE